MTKSVPPLSAGSYRLGHKSCSAYGPPDDANVLSPPIIILFFSYRASLKGRRTDAHVHAFQHDATESSIVLVVCSRIVL
jgi:hypothetical protein